MKSKDILLAFLVVTIWGSYFLVTKIALFSFPPMFLSGIRYLLLFVFTCAFLFKEKVPIKKIFLLSIVLFVNLVALNHAILYSSNLAPIILLNELTVPFSVILGIYFLKEKVSLKDIIGIILAIIGSIVVITIRSLESVNSIAIILIILASILFSFYNLIAKELSKFNSLTILAYLSFFTFPQFLLLSYFQETWPNIEEISLSSIIALLYIAIIVTLMGYYLWFYLLNKYPLNKVTPFTLLSPVIGCISSYYTFLEEKIDHIMIIGGAILILGIIIIEYERDYGKKKL